MRAVFAAALLVVLTVVSSSSVPLLNDEVVGLIVFKSGLSDPAGALSSWNADDDTPCRWAHLTCDPSTAQVRGISLQSLSLSALQSRLPRGLARLRSLRSLSLAGNLLSGDLSATDIPLIPTLRSLDLSANAFSGPIPTDLPLPSLRYLDLSSNRLSGPIPLAIPQQCTWLLHLNLSSNQLSGNALSDGALLSSLSRLRVLDLSHNSFSGPVPESIAALHNLKVLRLNGNRFSGNVPVGVGLCTHLDVLDFSLNSLDGPIPASLNYLASVTSLAFSDNSLSGDLPDWIANLTALRYLDLSNNKLTGKLPNSLGALKQLSFISLSGNALAGAIPASVGECPQLKEVRLKGNGMGGSIPQGLFDLGLEVLDLSSNNLTGGIPPGSDKLSESLRELDLSHNQLTGVIPPEMALYFNLRYLNLSWNNLRSRLPPELGYFRNLSVLDLRSSSMYGPIPGDLCESGSLSVLQLDGNSLTGPIPPEIRNCSSLYLLSLSHNELSGSIPIAISELKKLEILNLEFNNLGGEIPQQLGALDNLLAVNISHNRLIGRLPMKGIFQSLQPSALQGNLGLCTPLVAEPCKMNVSKPLVLDPNAYFKGDGDDAATTSPVKLQHRRFLSLSAIVAISAALAIALAVVVVSMLNISVRRRIGLMENSLESKCSSSIRSGCPAVGKTVLFGPRNSLRSEDLVGGAESLLSKATEIGRGVFGTVYKAPIGEGRIIAIKKLLSANIIQFHDDLDREVRVLGKARHPNLMPIKGYYWTPQLQLLISDYAPNGSLQSRLHERSESTPPLSWANRFKIVFGTARGLAHLHQSFRPPIIHYSIKPSNILLDEDLNPMISDFGLVRLLPKLDKHIVSSRFQSAMGYVAPELACQSMRINEKCDVYGFGVLILELVTGRKAVEYGEDDVVVLIDQVRVLLESGNVLDCVDSGMGEFPEEEVLPVLKLGLVCTSQIPSSRPSMAEVVQILQVIKTPVLERMEEGF